MNTALLPTTTTEAREIARKMYEAGENIPALVIDDWADELAEALGHEYWLLRHADGRDLAEKLTGWDGRVLDGWVEAGAAHEEQCDEGEW